MRGVKVPDEHVGNEVKLIGGARAAGELAVTRGQRGPIELLLGGIDIELAIHDARNFAELLHVALGQHDLAGGRNLDDLHIARRADGLRLTRIHSEELLAAKRNARDRNAGAELLLLSAVVLDREQRRVFSLGRSEVKPIARGRDLKVVLVARNRGHTTHALERIDELKIRKDGFDFVLLDFVLLDFVLFGLVFLGLVLLAFRANHFEWLALLGRFATVLEVLVEVALRISFEVAVKHDHPDIEFLVVALGEERKNLAVGAEAWTTVVVGVLSDVDRRLRTVGQLQPDILVEILIALGNGDHAGVGRVDILEFVVPSGAKHGDLAGDEIEAGEIAEITRE